MKMNFKLEKVGTAIVSIITLLAIIIVALSPTEFSFIFAGIACYAFYTCSKSDAFSKDGSVAWLVAIVSIVVAIVSVIAKLTWFFIRWLLHLIIKTPPAKIRW